MAKLVDPVVPPGVMANRDQPDLVIDDALRGRPFRGTDAAAVVEAFEDPLLQQWHFRRFASVEDAEAWIAVGLADWSTEQSVTWAVVDASDQLQGRVTLYLDLERGHAEISYWVLPGARRRGVATRACKAATQWAHDLGIHRVELQHSDRNEASGGVALVAGFVREGVRREAQLLADGWHDMVVHARLANDE